MLTIAEIRSLSPDELAAYQRDIAEGIAVNARRLQWARDEELGARDRVVTREAHLAEFEKQRDTLTAAGLWPLPAAPPADGGTPCAD